MFDFFRAEPLYHYPMDRFTIKSPILYQPHHRIVHVGGGPNRNHPLEINLNLFPMTNVDVVATAHELPFGDGSLDAVISNAVLEHVEDLDRTVGEMRRVLKPGGFVYIEIPFMQHYHTHDSYGVKFEDYRRLTKRGLTDVFHFCTPLDVGVCVGPASTVCQVAFSFLRDLSEQGAYRRAVDGLYRVLGNSVVWIDRFLSNETIQRSAIPSGIYFFGRKHDALTPQLDRLPQPNSAFPRDVSAEIEVASQTPERVELLIRNNSQTTWLKHSPLPWGQVRVGLLHRRDGHTDRDFRRAELPHDIRPGETFRVAVDMADYADADELRVDLVMEQICWFADRGNRELSIPIQKSPARPPALTRT